MCKEIWLIGNRGMLGREFERYFSKKGIKILKSDIDLNISIKQNIDFFLKQNPNIKWIINCAAYTNVEKANQEEDLAKSINYLALRNISKSIKKKDISLIHFSTDYVFDGKKTNPYNEQDKCNPLSVYGKSKYLGELEIINNLEKYYIFRISWLYGNHGNNFVKTMIKLFEVRDEISVIDDQIGSPTYAKKLVENIFNLIEKNNNNYGIYHYQDKSSGISWYDFANKILEHSLRKEIVKKKINIRRISSELYNSSVIRPEYSFFNLSKVKKELNFSINDFESNLVDFLKDYRSKDV